MKNKHTKQIIIRLIIILLGIAVTILYIGPLVISGEKSLGVIFGLGIAFILFLYAILFNPINRIIKNFNKAKSGNIITSIVRGILTVCIAIGGFLFANIVSHGNQSKKSTEYVIVLGCVLRGDRPGIYLTQRLNTAYDYLTENPNSIAILSGGQGKDEKISEAECMYNYLIEKGIEPSRLLLESKSTSTNENFEYTRELLNEQGTNVEEITVITHNVHEYRAAKFAQRYDFKAYSYPCKTPWRGFMPFATREIFAVIYQIYLS